MNKYILAHDLGTSGNKATLFDTDGRLIASEIREYDTFYFNDNWAEQNPEDWWLAVKISTKELIRKSGIDGHLIAAISFSGQMMGCLCVDRDGVPLRNSIIWADNRAVRQSEYLNDKISQQDYYHIVGHRNTPSYGIQKLMWIKDQEYEVYNRTYKMLNAKDYIVFKLTGKFYTDFSDANSTGGFDINRWQWSEDIIRKAGLDMDKFPDCKPSKFVAGSVMSSVADELGISADTKVVLGAGDGVATNVGAGSISPGKTFCCLGTSAWITTTATAPVYDEEMRIVTWAHMIEGLYAPNGTMQFAGGAYSWIRDQICLMETYNSRIDGKSPYDYMNKLIKQSPIGANGIIFLPHFLGERAPRWDRNSKGAFVGMTPANTRADLVRSVLEGVSLNLSLILDVLRNFLSIKEVVVLGGGAKGDVWREILANTLNSKLLVPELLDEAGAMGAAVNAGVGAGIYRDYSAIEKFLNINTVQEPEKEAVETYKNIKEKFDDCYYSLKPYFEKYK